ncbi:ROK family protein [Tabrizicola sp. J26]|uniref:ROK family protein n=1 Tax=Alitabrizicola rongguiensis TaxID=2909234 RepID=UPI001F27D165|nr:ROK family protein [Tabrizicola rongguiensis]MCF1708346.1 ROK family protein [Tabrizicola rongguiensis]
MLVCFDIGGSRIKAARSPAPGIVEPLGEVPTPRDDARAFAEALRRFVGNSAAIAISITGVVAPETGRIRVANIPGLNGTCLAEDLRAALGKPVWVGNDADCFTLAEAARGAGRGHRNVFGVILGTGVGGGLVIDGRLISGAGGYVGEWGHGPAAGTTAAGWMVPRLACGCGLTGCIDTVGGARGIERLHRHLNGVDASSRQIVEDWRSGDAAAIRTIAVWRDLVAGPLAMVLNTVGSSVVPVGGGLSTAPDLIAALDIAVRGRVLRPDTGQILKVAEAAEEPGLVGASLAGHAEFGHD